MNFTSFFSFLLDLFNADDDVDNNVADVGVSSDVIESTPVRLQTIIEQQTRPCTVNLTRNTFDNFMVVRNTGNSNSRSRSHLKRSAATETDEGMYKSISINLYVWVMMINSDDDY